MYDQPDEAGLTSRVRCSYLLCSMPRSGSSLLSEALCGLGRLGTPIEYFDRTGAFRWLCERWGCDDVEEYVRLLHHRRPGPTGVFGAKLHWFHLEELAAALRVTVRRAVDRVFPGCSFVHVTRRDRDRQAVSWAVAMATGHWSAGAGVYEGERPRPAYSFEAIERCHRVLEDSDRRWRAFFRSVGARPMRVDYEDLVADHAGTVAAVARFLGEAVSPADVPPPRLVRQADDHTEAMVERYRSERRQGSSSTASP